MGAPKAGAAGDLGRSERKSRYASVPSPRYSSPFRGGPLRVTLSQRAALRRLLHRTERKETKNTSFGVSLKKDGHQIRIICDNPAVTRPWSGCAATRGRSASSRER